MPGRQALVAILALLLPAVLLLPVWLNRGLGAGEDDILYYWPMRLHFQRCLDAGEWPFFNPWNGLGRPFLADPQTAILYPGTWLFALAKIELAYPLHLALHFSLAFWGAYRLARSEKLHAAAAVFAAIAFAFCGFMLAHRAHFTMQAAAAWTPIVVWRLRRAAGGELRGGRRVRALLFAAMCIALQALAGHVQMAALTALAAAALVVARRESTSQHIALATSIRQRAILLAFVFASGAALFAPQAIPTWRYLRECERASWGYRQFTENSLLPSAAITMVSPFLLGQRTPNAMGAEYWGPSHQSEQTGYVGLLTLLLAALALRSPWRALPARSPWVWLLLIAFLLALGRYGPLCPILYWLPGSQLFRCPARALLLIDLALAMLAAYTVDDLVREATPLRARLRWILQQWTLRWPLLSALLVIAPLLLVILSLPWLDGASRAAAARSVSPLNPAVWAAVAVALMSLGTLAFVVRRGTSTRAAWLLPLVLALDLGLLGWSIDVPRDRVNVSHDVRIDAARDWMDAVAKEPGRLWVVTPPHAGKPGEYSNSLAKAVANSNLLEPLESLTDYGPLQLRAYVQTFGFRPWGETARAAELLTTSDWMRDARVLWVLLCDASLPAPSDSTRIAQTPHGWRLYRMDASANAPLARFVDPNASGTVNATWRSNPEIDLRFDDAPTREAAVDEISRRDIVVSVTGCDGWTIEAAGRSTPIRPTGELMLGLSLDPNATHATLHYAPPGLAAGVAIAASAAVVWVALLVASFFVRDRQTPFKSSTAP